MATGDQFSVVSYQLSVVSFAKPRGCNPWVYFSGVLARRKAD
jgi:hypothetical protein